MAHKKELTEQEKIAEILKNTSVSFDPKKAQEYIALNTRCKRCGRTLSSLERITFGDKCVDCMKDIMKKKRDTFVRKYILIAFAFVVALVLGGYCANSDSKVWRIVGVAFSAVMLAFALGYVFYTNMDKIIPNVSVKIQTWIVLGLALGIDMIISILTYISNSWVLYIVLMLAVAVYVAYIAYNELLRLKENINLINVYDRKSRDKQYVESITEAIEKRSVSDKKAEEESNSHTMESDDEIAESPADMNVAADKSKADAESCNSDKAAAEADKIADGEKGVTDKNGIDKTLKEKKREDIEVSDRPEDNGEFFI